MENRNYNENIKVVMDFVEAVRTLATTATLEIMDAANVADVIASCNKIERLCVDLKQNEEHLDDVEGHTKYIQGVELPIMINSIVGEDGNLVPSKVGEMHVGMVNGEKVLLITPEEISLPD